MQPKNLGGNGDREFELSNTCINFLASLTQDAFIAGAINLPAHSFYPTRQTAITLLSQIPLVIFHCQSCSPTGRGPRVAGWYAEELNRRKITSSKALVLDGGIKGFKDACCSGENANLVEALPNLS